MTLPSDTGHVTFTLSDGSQQTVAVSPGSYTLPNFTLPIAKAVGSA